jgi:hypothetical protein
LEINKNSIYAKEVAAHEFYMLLDPSEREAAIREDDPTNFIRFMIGVAAVGGLVGLALCAFGVCRILF